MKKQAISAALAGTMLVGTMAAPAMAVSVDQFTDIKTTDWFYPYVQKVAEKDYMIGVGGNLFAPTTEMSRAMFVTVLARLEGVDEENAKSNFDDVPDDTWYTSAVNWAAANGIVEGNGAGKFMPEDQITRQDMCTMMARYVAYHQKKHNVTHVKPGTEKTFTDEDQIADYAAKFVEQCVAWGLIEGNDLGQFMPKSFTTRAEAAAVISRLSWRANGGGGTTPSTWPKTANYTVSVELKVPEDVQGALQIDPVFQMEYKNVTINKDGTVEKDQSLATVASALVETDAGNKSVLEKCIEQALKKITEKPFTQEVKGQTVTVSIDKNTREITASVAVKVTDITKNGTTTFGVDDVTNEQLEELIKTLQGGGVMTFTKTDLEAMVALLDKINEVNNLTENEFNDFKSDYPELEKVLNDIDLADVKDAADNYKQQVEGILKDLNVTEQDIRDDLVTEGEYTTTKEMEPVLMSLEVNLVGYYNDAVAKFSTPANKSKAIDRLISELKPSGTFNETSAKEKAGALYDLNDPSKYVEEKEGKLYLKSDEDYYELVVENVNATVAFYESLEGDAAFYESLLTRMENKYKDNYSDEKYGVEYDYSENFVTNMASLLSDPDGIFVDDLGENIAPTFRDNMSFSVTATANDTTYASWLDVLTGKFDQASILPESVPSVLSNLLGEYTLTFTIEKK